MKNSIHNHRAHKNSSPNEDAHYIRTIVEKITGITHRVHHYISSREAPKARIERNEKKILNKQINNTYKDIQKLIKESSDTYKDEERKILFHNEMKELLHKGLEKVFVGDRRCTASENAAPELQNKIKKLSEETIEACFKDEKLAGALFALREVGEKHYATLIHSIDAMAKGILLADLIRNDSKEAFSENDIIEFGKAMLLHDIGKIYISNDILDKNGRLDTLEYEQMKLHTLFGEWIISNLGKEPTLQSAVSGSHHDGFLKKGYGAILTFFNKFTDSYIVNRDNLKFQMFSEMAAIVDIYSALKEERSYKKAKSTGQALMIMSDMARNGQINPYYYDIWYKFIYDHEKTLFPIGSEIFLDDGQKSKFELDGSKRYTAKATKAANAFTKTIEIFDIYEESKDEITGQRGETLVMRNQALNLRTELDYKEAFAINPTEDTNFISKVLQFSKKNKSSNYRPLSEEKKAA